MLMNIHRIDCSKNQFNSGSSSTVLPAIPPPRNDEKCPANLSSSSSSSVAPTTATVVPSAASAPVAELSGLRVWTSIHDQYRTLEILGQGTYGVVYKAEHKLTGEIVALKRCRLDKLKEFGIPETTLRELVLLRDLRHENIMQLFRVSCNTERLYMICEFLDFDLKKYIRAHTKIQYRKVKEIMYEILKGLAYCHGHRVVHRDLKPHNILVSLDATAVKIADFGLARCLLTPGKTLTHEVVTLWYRSPELLLGHCNYSSKVDIWSAGCICAELLSGTPLFIGDSEIDTLFKICRFLGTPEETQWPQNSVVSWKDFPKFKGFTDCFKLLSADLDELGKDFLSRMLSFDSTKRWTAKKLLEHDWLNEVRSSATETGEAAVVEKALSTTKEKETSYTTVNKRKLTCSLLQQQYSDKNTSKLLHSSSSSSLASPLSSSASSSVSCTESSPEQYNNESYCLLSMAKTNNKQISQENNNKTITDEDDPPIYPSKHQKSIDSASVLLHQDKALRHVDYYLTEESQLEFTSKGINFNQNSARRKILSSRPDLPLLPVMSNLRLNVPNVSDTLESSQAACNAIYQKVSQTNSNLIIDADNTDSKVMMSNLKVYQQQQQQTSFLGLSSLSPRSVRSTSFFAKTSNMFKAAKNDADGTYFGTLASNIGELRISKKVRAYDCSGNSFNDSFDKEKEYNYVNNIEKSDYFIRKGPIICSNKNLSTVTTQNVRVKGLTNHMDYSVVSDAPLITPASIISKDVPAVSRRIVSIPECPIDHVCPAGLQVNKVDALIDSSVMCTKEAPSSSQLENANNLLPQMRMSSMDNALIIEDLTDNESSNSVYNYYGNIERRDININNNNNNVSEQTSNTVMPNYVVFVNVPVDNEYDCISRVSLQQQQKKAKRALDRTGLNDEGVNVIAEFNSSETGNNSSDNVKCRRYDAERTSIGNNGDGMCVKEEGQDEMENSLDFETEDLIRLASLNKHNGVLAERMMGTRTKFYLKDYEEVKRCSLLKKEKQKQFLRQLTNIIVNSKHQNIVKCINDNEKKHIRTDCQHCLELKSVNHNTQRDINKTTVYITPVTILGRSNDLGYKLPDVSSINVSNVDVSGTGGVSSMWRKKNYTRMDNTTSNNRKTILSNQDVEYPKQPLLLKKSFSKQLLLENKTNYHYSDAINKCIIINNHEKKLFVSEDQEKIRGSNIVKNIEKEFIDTITEVHHGSIDNGQRSLINRISSFYSKRALLKQNNSLNKKKKKSYKKLYHHRYCCYCEDYGGVSLRIHHNNLGRGLYKFKPPRFCSCSCCCCALCSKAALTGRKKRTNLFFLKELRSCSCLIRQVNFTRKQKENMIPVRCMCKSYRNLLLKNFMKGRHSATFKKEYLKKKSCYIKGNYQWKNKKYDNKLVKEKNVVAIQFNVCGEYNMRKKFSSDERKDLVDESNSNSLVTTIKQVLLSNSRHHFFSTIINDEKRKKEQHVIGKVNRDFHIGRQRTCLCDNDGAFMGNCSVSSVASASQLEKTTLFNHCEGLDCDVKTDQDDNNKGLPYNDKNARWLDKSPLLATHNDYNSKQQKVPHKVEQEQFVFIKDFSTDKIRNNTTNFSNRAPMSSHHSLSSFSCDFMMSKKLLPPKTSSLLSYHQLYDSNNVEVATESNMKQKCFLKKLCIKPSSPSGGIGSTCESEFRMASLYSQTKRKNFSSIYQDSSVVSELECT